MTRKLKPITKSNISKKIFDNIIDDIKDLYQTDCNVSLQEVRYWNKRFIDKNKLRNTQCEDCYKNLLKCECNCHWW